MENTPSLAKRFLLLTLLWLILVGLWFLFTGSGGIGETVASLIAAALSVLGFEFYRQFEPVQFRPKFRWLLQALHLPLLIGQGTFVLIKVLIRKFRGKPAHALFQLAEFDAGGTDARSSAKRALVTTFTTLPPNFIVVHIENDRNLMLFHQVEKNPMPQIIQNLEH